MSVFSRVLRGLGNVHNSNCKRLVLFATENTEKHGDRTRVMKIFPQKNFLLFFSFLP